MKSLCFLEGQTTTSKMEGGMSEPNAGTIFTELESGHVVANGPDPLKYGFICGTVIDKSDAFCTVLLPGGSRGFVYAEEAVLLKNVVEKYPDQIVAERRAWEEQRVFIGGAILGRDNNVLHVGVCGGRVFIPQDNAVMAISLW